MHQESLIHHNKCSVAVSHTKQFISQLVILQKKFSGCKKFTLIVRVMSKLKKTEVVIKLIHFILQHIGSMVPTESEIVFQHI